MEIFIPTSKSQTWKGQAGGALHFSHLWLSYITEYHFVLINLIARIYDCNECAKTIYSAIFN